MKVEPVLWLVPEAACQGASGLTAAGESIRELRGGAGGRIEAASAARPWGRDTVGTAFERHYRGYEQQLLDAWEAISGYLAELGDAVNTAVGESLATDQASSARFMAR